MVNVADPIQVRGKVIPADELSWRFSRSSGPGGQSVNTSDSRVELSYDLAASSALGPVLKERALAALADRLVNGVLTISASEHRSQLRNREAATRRLASVLTSATAPPGGRPNRPAARGNAGLRPSSAARRSSGSAAPPTSDQIWPDQLRRRPVTVTASPPSAINGPIKTHKVTPVITLPLMKPRPCSVQTTPAMAMSMPARERTILHT
jgi:ribosome-associated protein